MARLQILSLLAVCTASQSENSTWACVVVNHQVTPMRIVDDIVECMSNNDRYCEWRHSPGECRKLIENPVSPLRPVKCDVGHGMHNRNNDPLHFCAIGREMIQGKTSKNKEFSTTPTYGTGLCRDTSDQPTGIVEKRSEFMHLQPKECEGRCFFATILKEVPGQGTVIVGRQEEMGMCTQSLIDFTQRHADAHTTEGWYYMPGALDFNAETTSCAEIHFALTKKLVHWDAKIDDNTFRCDPLTRQQLIDQQLIGEVSHYTVAPAPIPTRYAKPKTTKSDGMMVFIVVITSIIFMCALAAFVWYTYRTTGGRGRRRFHKHARHVESGVALGAI